MPGNEDIIETRIRLEQEFQIIAEAMKKAVIETNHSFASEEAVRFHMTETAPSKPIGTAWQKIENGRTLRLQWRYYDQSRPFSVQKDMNILSLELREGDQILKQTEERFED
jgi:hypothetical protein